MFKVFRVPVGKSLTNVEARSIALEQMEATSSEYQAQDLSDKTQL
jgi:hypothetical protein